MNPRFVGILLFIIFLSCFATGVVVYPNLPAVFVSHWSIAGYANGTVDRLWGAFTLPMSMLALIGVWALLPRIDPLAPGFMGFRYVYDFFFFLILSFLAYAYALMLGANLGWQFAMPKTFLSALALLIFGLGALLPYLKRNWFIGIRTPWTISSALVWDKTHRLGSKLFEIAALFIFASGFVPRAMAIWFVLAPPIIAALISAVYSYVVYNSRLLYRRNSRGQD